MRARPHPAAVLVGCLLGAALVIPARSADASATSATTTTGGTAPLFSSGNAELALNPLTDNTVLVIPSAADEFGVPQTSDVGQAAWMSQEGWVTGWNIKDIRMRYDPVGDRLAIGLNFFSIAGDADGNGNPGGSDPRTVSAGGFDSADLGFGEMIVVGLDLDNSGQSDIVAGVPRNGDINDFKIARYDEGAAALPFAFGEDMSEFIGDRPINPSAENPDFLFSIRDFSQLPGLDLDEGFGIEAYAGTVYDMVAGEQQMGLTRVARIAPQVIPEPTTWLAWAAFGGFGAAWAYRRRRIART